MKRFNEEIPPHLQGAVVEEHDEGVFRLDPLEQQRRRTSDVLLTEQITTLMCGKKKKKRYFSLFYDMATFLKQSNKLELVQIFLLRFLPYLHKVLLHVVGHEFYNLFLAVKLLR